ncbi:flagellar hook-associated protein FlgL [Metapseudomonas boanensis]|uniref:Flagellar hook-associated protein FlgL n=1 Tax=Metapseudomonas boanensis TaxID=2822138 RepID=A0ABS5XFI7_9GAMM|nr:flagellar hook-associated protein FlgL [Pseudomonas boanensis]MBT8766449.1 flagellar hook-associated protein FlgL [Pseudomonas boanensis]
MRISTLQAFNNGVSGLQRNYSDVTRTQEQISSGKRILTPADDPVASVRLLQLEQQQNVLSQYQGNLAAAQNSLNQEEATLDTVSNLMQRVRELAVQAGNGALSSADRRSIATELDEREEELFGLMNTRNARGEYLFAGFQGKTQPFVRNADGTYSYQGDEGQRKLQVASSLDIAISDNGRAVFENAVNAGRLSVSGNPAAPAGPLVSGALVDDEVTFASFPQGGIQLDFNDPANPLKYNLTPLPQPAAGPVISGTLAAGKDTKVSYGGVTFHVNGTPPNGSSFTISPPDSDPATAPANKVGILDTIANLRMALEQGSDSPQGAREVRDSVALAITNLDHGMTTLDTVRGQIGARLNTVESTQTSHDEVSLVNKSVQAELRDLDYAEALSRLSMQSIILEAAQQSYVKVSSLNLFNQLR